MQPQQHIINFLSFSYLIITIGLYYETGCVEVLHLLSFIILTALICIDDSTIVDDILPLLDTNPCLSVIALCTLLKIDGFYPVNPDFEAQKSLLQGLSTQILVDFEVVLEREQKRNMDECAQADIDFEFVIDSSGQGVKIKLLTPEGQRFFPFHTSKILGSNVI